VVEWVLASHNRGKAAEFDRMLKPYGVTVLPLYLGEDEVVPEEGDTYLANALTKARWAAERLGRLALADDSGLEVDALDGRPGIHSARYGGGEPANLLRVLEELMAVPWERRTARMTATVVLAWPDGRYLYGTGVVEGRMAMVPRGRHGFGYDPGFELPDGRTFAEIDPAEKDAVSHRRRALDALWVRWLEWSRRDAMSR
jgi:XTP/dITP diphosphohydrolase